MHKIIVKVADFVFIAAAVLVVVGASLAAGLLGGIGAFLGSCIALSIWSVLRCIQCSLANIERVQFGNSRF